MSLKNKDRSCKSSIINELHNYNILIDTREIFLHSYISDGDDDGIDYKVANNFLKNIRFLEQISDQEITIHLNSIGGSWSDGMLIFDAIKCCRCETKIITHGIASSMGSIIPQAANRRITMPNCFWLLHEGYVESSSIRRQARSWHVWSETTLNFLMDLYIECCSRGSFFQNKNEKYIRRFLKRQFEQKEDWILSAKEAIEYGFCDEIYNVH